MVNHPQYSVSFTIISGGKQLAILRVVYDQIGQKNYHSLHLVLL